MKRNTCIRRALLLCVALLSMTFANSGEGFALNAANSEYSSDVSKNLENQISTIEQQLSQLKKDLKSTESAISDEMANKENLDTQLALVGESIVAAQELVTSYAGQISTKEQEIARKEQSIEEKYEEFEQWLLMTYENDEENYLAMVLSAENLEDFLSATEWIANIISYQNELMRELDLELEQLQKEKDDLNTLYSKQTETVTRLEGQQDVYEELSAQSAQYLNSLWADAASMENAYEKAQKALEEKNAELEEELERLAKQNTVFIGGDYMWPVDAKYSRSYPYGWRSYPVVEFHRGLDIPANGGENVYASLGGTVVKAESHYSYGNYVVIDHGGGRSTLYAHASKLLVSAGDKVNQGDVIAKVGSTGFSTGNHLHFEVRIDGATQNPLDYVAAPSGN